ncbi:MAG: IS3 family transposase [Bacteroidota bacterium]|nr:IS3 family transposase [Bacteroidota bacterium]
MFRYTNYSKQAFHQKMDRMLLHREMELLLLPIITELRADHPGVAARQLYFILRPKGIGRDKFEQICFQNGFKLERLRSWRRTTDSSGVIRFPNLVTGIEFTDVNQLWVSDITYYQIGQRFYYLTFILDNYSRMIVGHSVSKQLLTEQTTLPALQTALQKRKPKRGLIFHSDGGGQYYCKSFIKLTESFHIKNSMCDVAYENPYAERINGTIKNQYLKGYNPQNYNELVSMTDKAIYNYNYVRPHKSLKNQTPAGFEQQLGAGGTSSVNDNFCIFTGNIELQKKNYHSPMTKKQKAVNKTVNVF